MYIRLAKALLAWAAVGAGIWAGARWAGVEGFSAAFLALGTVALGQLCNLRWPLFAKLLHIQLYDFGVHSVPSESVQRKLGSRWLLMLCCAGAVLWGMGFAALLAGDAALAHFLWIAVVFLHSCAVLATKHQPLELGRTRHARSH